MSEPQGGPPSVSAEPGSVISLQPGGSATPVFCVHAGSGSAYHYWNLAGLLGPERAVYGLQAPGFADSRVPVRSIAALGTAYAQEVRDTVRDRHGELVLLGWSLGGVIAHRMACELAAAGAPIRLVVLVDVSVPTIAPLPAEKEIVTRFLRDLLAGEGGLPRELERRIAALDDKADSDAAFELVQAADEIPGDLDVDFLSERFATFRALVEASYGYEVTKTYDGDVLHLTASDSGLPARQWQPFAPQLTEHSIPGTHYSIWSGAGLHRLAELVGHALETQR